MLKGCPWGKTKSHILTFINKDTWNFCQMNLMSADLDFITFVWVFMIVCTDVPTESINSVVIFFILLIPAMPFYVFFIN